MTDDHQPDAEQPTGEEQPDRAFARALFGTQPADPAPEPPSDADPDGLRAYTRSLFAGDD